ncbi:hypothetical protein EDD86DRAFT_219983 [Gorgonomyces haynaldii]|nr:hypothetical protein EDD86DRAFT_219983 [Gorgonomyces haynaldii]
MTFTDCLSQMGDTAPPNAPLLTRVMFQALFKNYRKALLYMHFFKIAIAALTVSALPAPQANEQQVGQQNNNNRNNNNNNNRQNNDLTQLKLELLLANQQIQSMQLQLLGAGKSGSLGAQGVQVIQVPDNASPDQINKIIQQITGQPGQIISQQPQVVVPK